MGEGRVSLTPCADFYRPVQELEYTDLLRNTFTQSGHERASKLGGLRQLTLSVSFVAKSIGGGRVRWNVTWTQPLQKAVQSVIRAKMQ
jgi:hypothetical protein